MTHGRVPCVYRMRRTWSSSSYSKNSSMGRRLRWNQTENSLKLSLASAYETLAVRLQRSLTAMPDMLRHSPKYCFRRLSGRQGSDFHARTAAHRGRNGQLAQIYAFGSSGARLVQGVNQCCKVGLQLFHTKRGAANRGVNNTCLVGAILHLAGLGVL